MFRLRYEESPADTETISESELADLIEKGLTYDNVSENRSVFLVPHWEMFSNHYSACALGYALVGKYGSARKARKEYVKSGAAGVTSMQQLLNIRYELATKISAYHAMGGQSAKDIVRMLREDPNKEVPLEEPKLMRSFSDMLREIERDTMRSFFTGYMGRRPVSRSTYAELRV